MNIYRTSYQGQYIRFFWDENHTFWFSAVDIEPILGYAPGGTSCFRYLHKNFISHIKIGKNSFRFVSEKGVCIALQSPKMKCEKQSKAIAFRYAFINEIMPALIKSYGHDEHHKLDKHDEHNGHKEQLKLFDNDNTVKHIEVPVPLNIFEKLSAFALFTGQDIPHVLSGLAQSFVLKHQERIQQALENKKVLEAIKNDYMKVGDNT